MRVLVTGGTGFVGSWITQHYTEQGHWVKTLARGNKHVKPDFECDITAIDREVTNFDVIIHAASTVNEYNLLDGTDVDAATNVVGTQCLLEACRKYNKWAKIVYISTFFANGDPGELPVTERTVCLPKGLYGASKLCAEHYCKTYARVFGMDIRIVRATNLYGPGQYFASQKTAAFNWMIKTCVENGVIPLYDNGVILRDYLYAEDAMLGIQAVEQVGESGQVYLLGSGEPHSFNEMVNIMIQEAGGGSILSVPSPAFHQRVGIGDFWVDNSKLRGLGWAPSVSIQEGIRRTVEFYNMENNV